MKTEMTLNGKEIREAIALYLECQYGFSTEAKNVKLSARVTASAKGEIEEEEEEDDGSSWPEELNR